MIKTLRAIRAFIRLHGWLRAPEWTKDDEAALRQFLGSKVGRKFRQQLLALTVERMSNMLSGSGDACTRVGFATGFRAAVADIEALAGTHNLPLENDDSDMWDYDFDA